MLDRQLRCLTGDWGAAACVTQRYVRSIACTELSARGVYAKTCSRRNPMPCKSIQRTFIDKNPDKRDHGSNPHIKADFIGSKFIASKGQTWQTNFHKTKGSGFRQSLEARANQSFEFENAKILSGRLLDRKNNVSMQYRLLQHTGFLRDLHHKQPSRLISNHKRRNSTFIIDKVDHPDIAR
jgi:hypothetical protein